MLAWLVDGDDWAEIVYAETRGRAKVVAMREYDIDEFIDVRLKRAHWADGLDPAPTKVDWLQAGFAVECDGACFWRHPHDCYGFIYPRDAFDDYGLPRERELTIDGAALNSDGTVFCGDCARRPVLVKG